jgi:hypothetical protein
MRPLRALVLLGLIGCSSKQSDQPEPAKPGGAVAILLQAVGDLPKLEMRAAFAAGVEPGPHIEPLAGAIVDARKTCSSDFLGKTSSPQFVGVLHVDIKGGKLTATPSNEQGKCLAKALDGKTVKDAVDVAVDLQVSVATK